MSDQMPDEVWLDTYNAGLDNGTAKMQTDVYTPESVILPVCAVRYIRADLYEQVEAERDRLQKELGKRDAAAGVLVLELEVERDRLRAALERAREMAEDGKTSACSMQVCEDIELIAQEALDHD